MPFLEYSDFFPYIKQEHIEQLSPDTNTLAQAEQFATTIIKDHIGELYDMSNFSEGGSNRHPTLVRLCVVIALYQLYNRISDEYTPTRVIKDYDDAMQYLRDAARGNLNIYQLATVNDTENKPLTNFRWGSSPRRTYN